MSTLQNLLPFAFSLRLCVASLWDCVKFYLWSLHYALISTLSLSTSRLIEVQFDGMRPLINFLKRYGLFPPLLILMVLMLTPLAFGYLFSWLMLPFAVVTQRVLTGQSSTVLWWSVPALAVLALAVPFPRMAQMYGNTFFAALLLFFGLSIELLRCKRDRNGQRLEPF